MSKGLCHIDPADVPAVVARRVRQRGTSPGLGQLAAIDYAANAGTVRNLDPYWARRTCKSRTPKKLKDRQDSYAKLPQRRGYPNGIQKRFPAGYRYPGSNK